MDCWDPSGKKWRFKKIYLEYPFKIHNFEHDVLLKTIEKIHEILKKITILARRSLQNPQFRVWCTCKKMYEKIYEEHEIFKTRRFYRKKKSTILGDEVIVKIILNIIHAFWEKVLIKYKILSEGPSFIRGFCQEDHKFIIMLKKVVIKIFF